MQSQRVRVPGRENPLLIAHPGRMLPGELSSVLVPSEACALLATLPPSSVETLVDAWGHRFPNTREPLMSERVLAYLRERITSGALAVVRH